MKSEVRQLLTGLYQTSTDDCALEIYRKDDGVHICHYDFELDIYYHWVINERGKVINFQIGDTKSLI